MAITIDPQERELRALERSAQWRRRRVLEIGCGDGRLTLRLASLGARVSAIDPDASRVRAARAALSRRDARRIVYRVGSAERLPYRAREFDAVVFAWAL
jgi:ubiquinone/menaquinone biosynthesis C-methylase UbiE